MNAHTIVRLVFVPAFLFLAAADAPGLSDIIRGKTYLVRPDPVFDPNAVVPDANAKGQLRIDTKISTGRDRLALVVRGVDKNQTYNLFVENPDPKGDDFSAPIPLTGAGTTKTLKLDTDHDDPLPFDVEALADLEGMEVRIVVGEDPEDDASVYLRGHIPALGISKKLLKATQQLTLATNNDPNAKGKLWVQSTASNGDELVRVRVSALDFNSHDFSLWIEESVGSATYVKAGEFIQTKPNAGYYERRTKFGAPLPLDETSAADLSLRNVQVRDQTDVLPVADHAYLSTQIPLVN